jgi:5-methylcytosine-specific restriction endonuclease McrA
MSVKIETGICKNCHKKTYIQNKFKYWCSDCVYALSHHGKTKSQIAMEKSMQKKKPVKRTGERELFERIWNQRPHICTNCLSKLGDTPKIHFFAHLYPKSTHPELRLDPLNIVLLCYDCHYDFDFRGMHKHLKNKKT